MMQLPLTAVVQDADDKLVAIFEAKTNRRICMLYGNTSSEDAYDIVAAVNERAADKAEIERLRKALLQTDRVVTTMANRLQAMTTARKSDIAGHLQQAREYLTVYFDDYPCVLLGELRAALDAPEEPRP